MRSKVALLLLLVVAGFVLATTWERCEEGDDDCGALCHAGCLDGCATAPVPQALTATHAIATGFAAPEARADLPIARASRPEAQPPRG